MLRSIYEKLRGALRTNNRRKAPRSARHSGSRRLAIESLESRKLLTTTTLTYNSVADGSFEAPTLFPLTYQTAPGNCPWQFSGIAGVSANNSAFTVGNPNAPSGTQVAFIKNTGSMSQPVYLDAGVYNLSLLAAQRLNYNTQNENINVFVDSALVGVIAPASPLKVNNSTYTVSYTTYETSNFKILTTGEHTITFQGTSPSSADSTAFFDEVTITPAVDSLVDGGFEQPALNPNTFTTAPADLAWQFSGTAGAARNGSNFTTNWVEAQNAPDGTQLAYIQEYGSMSQTVYLDPGTYQLSFLAAQRAIYQSHYQAVEVLVDPNTPNVQNIGTIVPVNNSFGSYQTSTFTITPATAGAHTIEFVGLDPLTGDNTAFIDDVNLSANAISDGSFETPALNAQTYQLRPTGSPWQFTGNAGVDHNGARFTFNNPVAPDGTQVAYLEGNGGASQLVNLVAGTYVISFQAAQLANGQPQNQPIDVLVDPGKVNAQVVGLITPIGSTYSLYTSSNFTVTAGQHTIELLGMSAQGSSNTVLIDEVTLTAANDQISDGGFETPALPGYSYQVAPAGSSWQFSGGTAGITTNGSGVTSGSSNAPQGGQAAFIMNKSSISQTVYLDANTYNVSFMAAQRVVDQAQNQTIEVLLDPGKADAQVIGLITPSILVASSINTDASYAYALYQTSNFTVAAGSPIIPGPHTIEFLGMIQPSGNGESTALIDEVAITTVENTVSDGGFESPVLPAETYASPVNGTSPWQFSGLAGISTNASGFTNGSAYAPDGNQVAFIKNTGSITQPVYLDANPGTYSISFQAANRVGVGYQPQTIAVLVDGVQVALITPAIAVDPYSTTSSTYYIFTSYKTSNFTEPAGMHTIEFLGTTTTGDCTAFIDDVTISTGFAISDGSFEAPALAFKSYQVAPSGTSWQFSGIAGVSANASAFTFGNPVAPDGYQVAFIKDTGSISQQVYLAAGVYNISYMAAQRYYNQTQYQTIEVLVDGKVEGTATPDGPGANGGQYPIGTTFGLYSTINFTVGAGVHTVAFVGLSPASADSTAFIDDVQLNV